MLPIDSYEITMFMSSTYKVFTIGYIPMTNILVKRQGILEHSNLYVMGVEEESYRTFFMSHMICGMKFYRMHNE